MKKSTLKSTSTLKSNSTLKSHSTLRSNTTLKSNTTLRSNTRLRTHGYKKTVPDSTEGFAFPKHSRIINQSVIDQARRDRCEICGKPCNNEPHHIISRGAGGPDIPENLVQLCPICHTKAHTGEIPKDKLIRILARRLNISTDQLEVIVSEARNR